MDAHHPPEHLPNTINISPPTIPAFTFSYCIQLSSWKPHHLGPAKPVCDVNNINSMDHTNHPPRPAGLPPIIPSGKMNGPPKDPLLSDIVGVPFKSDSEIIRRHQEQNRGFRSLSPMEDNNQHFARSGEIDPGAEYDAKLQILQFSNPTHQQNISMEGLSPKLAKDPDEDRLMDLNYRGSVRNHCISSGALIGFSGIELNHQNPQNSGETFQVTNHQKVQSAILLQDQAAYGYDSNAEGPGAEGHDPTAHHQADSPGNPPEQQTDQNHGTHPNAQYPPQFSSGPLVLAPEQHRSDKADALHKNEPFVAQIPHKGQLEPQSGLNPQHDAPKANPYKADPLHNQGPHPELVPHIGLNPEHDALGANLIGQQRPYSEEPGWNPVGQDRGRPPGPVIRSGKTAGSRANPYKADPLHNQGPHPELVPQWGLNPPHDAPSAIPVGDQRPYVEETGSSPVGQAHWGPPRPGFRSGKSARAHPYKIGSRSKRSKLKSPVLEKAEMPVKQYLQCCFSTMAPLQQEEPGHVSQEAHTHPPQELQSHEAWDHPQQACQPDQLSYEQKHQVLQSYGGWDQKLVQLAPEQAWQPAPYGQEPWNSPPLQPLPQGGEGQKGPLQDQLSYIPQYAHQPTLSQNQLQYGQESWDPNQQYLHKEAHRPNLYQDPILYKKESWDQPTGLQEAPSSSFQDQTPGDQRLWSQPNQQYLPQGNFSYGTGPSPPAHSCSAARPLDSASRGCADIRVPPEPTYLDSDRKQGAPENINPQHWTERTSISEYTNDTTSSSAQSSPNFPQFQSMEWSSGEEELGQRPSKHQDAFRRAQEGLLSDDNDYTKDRGITSKDNNSVDSYANFASSIDVLRPIYIPRVPAARDSSPTSGSSNDGSPPPPPPSLSIGKKRRNRENPRLKRTEQQKRDRKREQNRKDSKKSVANRKTIRDKAAEQDEHILSLVEKQQDENLKFETSMEMLLVGHDTQGYLMNEKQKYIGWKQKIIRILDQQRDNDVEHARVKKFEAKATFEKYAADYKNTQGKTSKSSAGSRKCRAAQKAQLLESEYQILVNSHNLRREHHLKSLAELYFQRTVPSYIQQVQRVPNSLQEFIRVNGHLLYPKF